MSQFIEAVLFAEFDIDKGSVLRQQYPEKVSDDEGLLAELMLPEGSRARTTTSRTRPLYGERANLAAPLAASSGNMFSAARRWIVEWNL